MSNPLFSRQQSDESWYTTVDVGPLKLFVIPKDEVIGEFTALLSESPNYDLKALDEVFDNNGWIRSSVHLENATYAWDVDELNEDPSIAYLSPTSDSSDFIKAIQALSQLEQLKMLNFVFTIPDLPASDLLELGFRRLGESSMMCLATSAVHASRQSPAVDAVTKSSNDAEDTYPLHNLLAGSQPSDSETIIQAILAINTANPTALLSQNDQGKTLLHIAIEQQKWDIVKALQDCVGEEGLDIEDENGKTCKMLLDESNKTGQ